MARPYIVPDGGSGPVDGGGAGPGGGGEGAGPGGGCAHVLRTRPSGRERVSVADWPPKKRHRPRTGAQAEEVFTVVGCSRESREGVIQRH